MDSRYDDIAEKPLFGEARPKDRMVNLVVGAFTTLIVVATLITAFVVTWPPRGLSVYFALCIVLICGSHILLIYWYRQGDLEPKFRTLIYINAFNIILICVCANLYFHGVK